MAGYGHRDDGRIEPAMTWHLSRRRFIGGSVAAVCVGCGADSGTVMGGRVVAGTVDEVQAAIADGGAMYVAAASAYVAAVPADLVDAAVAAHDPALHAGFRAGFVALRQTCTHLGCRVQPCASSGWFECPCHAGHFDQLGDYRDGLAERGLDLLPVTVEAGDVVIDSDTVVTGRPKGSPLIDPRDADGPHCFEFGA